MIVAHAITRHQIAALIGCETAQVREAIARLGITPVVTFGNQELFDLDAIDAITQELPAMPKPRACGPAANMILPTTPRASTPAPVRTLVPLHIDPRQAWKNCIDVIAAHENVDRVTAAKLAAKRYPERRAALVAAANRTK